MKFEILVELACYYDMPDSLQDKELVRLCTYFDRKYFEIMNFFD